MADFTWDLDVSGVLKSHALSSKLREQAWYESKFMDFVRTEPGFGKKKGESLTITRADVITQPTSALLNETDRIPIDDFALSSVAITVSEFGRAIRLTHKSQLLNYFDPLDPVQRGLRRQMLKSLDLSAATTMKTTYLAFIPTSLSGGTFDETPLSLSTSALVNGNKAHLGLIRDAFRDTYIVPPYEGDDYIGLMSTRFLRGLKMDDDYVSWKQYLREGDVFHNSEVGKCESIRMIEIDDPNCLANNKGTNSVLGEALIFGEDFCAMVEAETPEVRVERNYGQELGRFLLAGWVGTLGWGLIWPLTASAGKVKGVWVTSA